MPRLAEFPFELQVCRWAERNWPPEGNVDCAVIVARQLGIASRRWDTIVLECDPDALERRAAFGERALDSDLLDVVPHAPAEWTWYQDALPDPGYPWRYVREAIHRAGDRNLIDVRKRNNRIEIRRRHAYPDWVERVVAIENKPDLDASAARDLAPQLHRDLALGLADEVWVATASTGDRVEPILLEDLPVDAGVLTLDLDGGGDDGGDATADVAWRPRTLAPDEPGTRILENPDPGDDHAAARFEYADPAWKATKRREIAERAYERGWRSYVDAMRPDCRHFGVALDDGWLPTCAARDEEPTPGRCREACPAFEPEPPVWRTRDWPIDGGPGKGVRRALDRQRRRRRPGLDETS